MHLHARFNVSTPPLHFYHRAAARPKLVNSTHNLVDAARNGFWWCKRCLKIVEVNCDGPQTACAKCGSILIKWHKPVID